MKPRLSLIFLLTLPCFAQSNEEKKAAPDRPNPPAEASPKIPTRPDITIDVLEDGKIKIEGTIVTLDELSKKIKITADQFPDQSIRIRGNRKSHYQTVVDVIDVCRKSGLKNVSFTSAPQ